MNNMLNAGLDGGRTFFNAVKEGDTVIFASDDEQDRILWVQAMYRATGQSHKPIPPTQVQKLNAKGGTAPQLDAPISQFCKYEYIDSTDAHTLTAVTHTRTHARTHTHTHTRARAHTHTGLELHL